MFQIEKHVNLQDFKIFVYKGVRGHNYVQPPTLAGYDVVLTSYNVLCSELDFLQARLLCTYYLLKQGYFYLCWLGISILPFDLYY